MTDREKVIKGLQIERECVSRDCDRDCGKCDLVQDRDWLLSVYDDALALLKEQEARVMGADEIVLSTDPSKWLWIERKGDYCAEAFKSGKTISGLIAFDSEAPCAFLYCERPDEYGKTWRCWTSRPTDEQREAVKWDE